MAVDLLPKRNFVEQIVPDLAFATRPPSGLGGAWGAWTQTIAATPNDFILHGTHYSWEFFTGVAAAAQIPTFQVQVGTGGPVPPETPIAQGAGEFLSQLVSDANVFVEKGTTMWFGPTPIPAGSRVAIRVWSDAAFVGPITSFVLFGYDARDYELSGPTMIYPPDRYMKGINSPGQSAMCYPSGGTIAIISGAAWAWSVPTQFIAAAANDIMITGLNASGARFNQAAQGRIEIGPLGFEVVGAQVGLPGQHFVPHCTSMLPRPLYVKEGERVTVSIAGAAALTANYVLLGHEVK